MNQPLVSIITAAYNSAATIKDTIASVLAQNYPHWEMLIVIDKGTTDATAQIVNQFTDPRIKFFHIKDKKGKSLSRNWALNKAQGKYITFLDADDQWTPTKLQDQVLFMEKNNYVFSCTGFSAFTESPELPLRTHSVPTVAYYKDLLKNNTIACLTVMINQNQTGPLTMLDEESEDYLLWLELLKKNHPCYGLDKVLAHYRVQLISGSSNKWKMLIYRWRVYRKYEKLKPLIAGYYLVHYIFTGIWKRR